MNAQDLKVFLERVATYLSFAEGEGEPVNRAPLEAEARAFLAALESGDANYHELTSFWFFFNGTGTMQTSKGASPEKAFSALGYGGGATRTIDYYSVVPKGSAVIERVLTWPDKEVDQREVLAHVVTEIEKWLPTLSKDALSEALDDFSHMLIRIEERFNAAHFVYTTLNNVYIKYVDVFAKL